VLLLTSDRQFTRTANRWGVDSMGQGRNMNRIVLLRKAGRKVCPPITQSGDKSRALQTLARPSGVSKPREASAAVLCRFQ
jgi:hypothetical protein